MPRVLGFDEVPQQPKTPLSAAAPRFLADRPNGQLEIIFYRSAAVYDGRFANNGWLQEMPDPMTRLTWDNAALISPATAKKLGVEDGTIVRLKFDGRELEIPAYVMPGQAADTVAVALGYGRTAAGHVGGLASAGIAPVGVDAYRLRTTKAMYFGTGLTVEPTGRKYELAATQNHHVIDNVGDRARRERAEELVQEWTLADCLAKAKSGAKGNAKGDSPIFAETKIGTVPAKIGTVPVQSDEGHRWGMAIDLSKCTGCSACVIACQAENNVPVVGKTQVLRGREMHWIRVDRYFRGDANDPAAAHQPVPCMQCENAPCEQVCPVAATVHTKEGLNDMVYNRCVGTRYCSNNCPFKVRRFNFFNYHKFLEDEANEVAKMAYNPEVTIRHRGVMEKCTYCVQRIQAVKITAKNQRRPIADGEIKTACQQACPAQAIVFGDLADDHSEVARAHRDQRAYGLLPHLDVRPRTLYLAKVRNPNPKLKDEPS
jgi:molybdopterin-containing oxidoreductase family iron-sulfur binding subunit